MTTQEPDLEAIAKKIVSVREDFNIGEIAPRIADALNDITRYQEEVPREGDDEGIIRYKHDFTDPQIRLEAAEQVYDVMGMHLHLLEFGFPSSLYATLNKFTNLNNIRYGDAQTERALGLSRTDLRNKFDDPNFDLSLLGVLKFVDEQIGNNYVPRKESEIAGQIGQEHFEILRTFINQNTAKAEYLNRTSRATTLEAVLGVYRELAKDLYGPGATTD